MKGKYIGKNETSKIHKSVQEQSYEFYFWFIWVQIWFWSFWDNFFDFLTGSQTPGMMPKHSPKVPKTFWKNFIFDPPNFFGTCPEHVKKVYLIFSYDVISYDMISYHMIEYHMNSYEFLSYDMIWSHIIGHDMRR